MTSREEQAREQTGGGDRIGFGDAAVCSALSEDCRMEPEGRSGKGKQQVKRRSGCGAGIDPFSVYESR